MLVILRVSAEEPVAGMRSDPVMKERRRRWDAGGKVVNTCQKSLWIGEQARVSNDARRASKTARTAPSRPARSILDTP